jgi:hypothetical protein
MYIMIVYYSNLPTMRYNSAEFVGKIKTLFLFNKIFQKLSHFWDNVENLVESS